MDLEAIWQTHKPFIVKVIAGAMTFLVLMGIRSSMANSTARTAKANTSKELAFQDKKTQLEGAEGLEKGRAKALEEKAEPALVEALMWRSAEAFTLPAKEKSPVLFYATALSKALRDIERRADKTNAKVPRRAGELGLHEGVEDPMVVEALARADLVRGVVIRLLDAGVTEITFVEPSDAAYRPRKGDERFLRTMRIRVAFVGTTRLLARVLNTFQVQGSFLQVRGCQIRRETKRSGASLVVDLDLQSLVIVDETPRGVSAAQRREPVSRGGTRNFGRDR